MTKILFSTINTHRALIGLLLALLTSLAIQAQTIRYVKPDDGRTPKNGMSWATAYDQNQLQQAIDDADASSSPDKQVWVAQGTYKPTTGTARNVSFGMRNNVAIYGGFATTGSPTMTSRNPASFTTILSGEIGDPASNLDNTYAVVLNTDFAFNAPNSRAVGPSAILDGFTITGGQARGGFTDTGTLGGGGMSNVRSSPTLRNCRFTDNRIEFVFTDNEMVTFYGGGMLNQESSPTLINCRFDNNRATFGGGLACVAFTGDAPSSPTLINCVFATNSAASGAAVYTDSETGKIPDGNNLAFTNCQFIENMAQDYGGAIYTQVDVGTSQVKLTNCSLVRNYAQSGGGIIANFVDQDSTHAKSTVQLTNCSLLDNGNNGSTIAFYGNEIFNATSFPSGNLTSIPTARPITRLTNCVLWGTQTRNFVDEFGDSMKKFTIITHSLLQPDISNYTDDGTNIKSNVFPFLTTNDVHLKAGSVAIDAGSNAAYSAINGPVTDLGGNPRIYNQKIDMGAYEFGSSALPVSLVSFRVQLQEDRTVLISWQTAWERANKAYLVERSKDLRTFEPVGEVSEVAANSYALTQYTLTDPTPYSGTSYYRLTQIDLSGKTTTYPAVSIVLRDEAYGVYPNPVVRNQRFTLRLDEPETARVSLYSSDSRLLQLQRMGIESGNLLLRTADNLPAGIYLVRVEERGQTRQHRIIVE